MCVPGAGPFVGCWGHTEPQAHPLQALDAPPWLAAHREVPGVASQLASPPLLSSLPELPQEAGHR